MQSGRHPEHGDLKQKTYVTRPPDSANLDDSLPIPPFYACKIREQTFRVHRGSIFSGHSWDTGSSTLKGLAVRGQDRHAIIVHHLETRPCD